MSHKGKTQLTYIFTVPPDLVAEGDRLFESHAAWMERTHPRDGDQALLSYTVVKGPEPSNPLDGSSKLTGNTNFVLSEIYETPAGVDNHVREAAESWEDLGTFEEWAGKANISAIQGSEILHSLW